MSNPNVYPQKLTILVLISVWHYVYRSIWINKRKCLFYIVHRLHLNNTFHIFCVYGWMRMGWLRYFTSFDFLQQNPKVRYIIIGFHWMSSLIKICFIDTLHRILCINVVLNIFYFPAWLNHFTIIIFRIFLSNEPSEKWKK